MLGAVCRDGQSEVAVQEFNLLYAFRPTQLFSLLLNVLICFTVYLETRLLMFIQ